MSKRNFILLIIILIIIGAGVMWFLYFREGAGPTDTGEGTNFISRFNPFGNAKPKPVEIPPTDISGYQPNPTPTTDEKLKKVSSMPIAGFIVYNKERLKDVPVVAPETPSAENPVTTPASPAKEVKPTAPATEFMPSLRYVARANGNIYQTFVDKIEERRFSGTVIPKVYEAFFGSKGDFVIMRYLKEDGRTIQTFVGNLPKEYLGADTTIDNEISGVFLPENIQDMSMSPDASGLFYLFTSGDSMIGTTLTLLNDKKVQIFDSVFTEWLSSWPNAKTITLTTKPSFGIPGYIYMLDGTNGKGFKKVFGGINGLTTLTSPDGKLVLYGNDSLSLSVYHMDTKVSDLLGIKTLPEKCVWGKISDTVYCSMPQTIPSGFYPDTWYQGEVSFSDQLWKIDIKTGNATMLIDPVTVNGGGEIDGTKLALDESENYLFFVNKKDSFLWEFNLK